MENVNSVGMVYDIPNQNVSYAKKAATDFEWAKTTCNAYIGRSTFTSNNWKTWLKKLYDYANGNIRIEDYKLITEPLGVPLEGDWADVQNFPIIKSKIDLLRSEYSKRPKKDMVYVINDDVVTEKTEALNNEIYNNLESLFLEKVNQQGIETGVEAEQPELPEKVKETFDSTYMDKRAMLGQNAIDYIKVQQRMSEKFDLEFFHWLVTGEVYSLRGVEHKEPTYEVVNPLDIDYDKDPDLQFVEDGDWVVRRKLMHPSGVIDMFYDDLTKEEITEIDTLAVIGAGFTFNTLQDKQWSRLVEVIHVCWKSRKQIGIVDFIDEYGEMQSLEVDELYTATPEQTLKKYWVNEGWETYRIGTNMFKRMRPLPNQRGSLDNLSKCKLPYNGRTMSNINSASISLTSLGVPYQVLYNATFHRLKLAMSKMKDDMALIDINWKPINWSMDKWLEYADRVSMLFVDYSKDSVRMNATHQTRLQLASQTINMYTELLTFIKQEWDEVCGITRQREGQISSSETVGGVERAVLQSSLITETYFSLFEDFRKRDLEAMIDYSKIAWIEGKKASFVMPDTAKMVYLDVNGEDYCEMEIGIAVSNSSKEQERANAIKQLAQPMMQNGMQASAIADILDSETIAEAKTKLKAAERKLQEYNQVVAEQEQTHEKQIEDMRINSMKNQQQMILEQIDRKGYWDLRKAELTALGMDEGDDSLDIMGQAKLAFENQKLNIESNLKNKEINANLQNDRERQIHEKDMKEKDASIKREEMKSKERIARSKPKTK